MRDASPPVTRLQEIADSTAALPERARALVDTLDRWLPSDAVWLTLSDPRSELHTTVGSTGLERDVLDHLDRASVARELRLGELHPEPLPDAGPDLPGRSEQLLPWADRLVPSGFRTGQSMSLHESGGPYVGMLGLLYARGEGPSAHSCRCLRELGPLLARSVSPFRSLVVTARLVEGAVAGRVLFRNGGTHALPGLGDHPLLGAGSPAVELARQMLVAGPASDPSCGPRPAARAPSGTRA